MLLAIGSVIVCGAFTIVIFVFSGFVNSQNRKGSRNDDCPWINSTDSHCRIDTHLN